MNYSKSKIITVTSAKGGVGKSVIALNLAGVSSNKKNKTLIIDLDLSSGVIGASLNIKTDENIFSLAEDMMNSRMKSFDNYIIKYNENIDVLCSPNDPRDRSKIHFQYIESIIKQLSFKYDIIIIDTNHIMDEVSSTAIDNSDLVLYVMTDDIMDIKNMKTIMAIYSDLDIDCYKIVLNEIFSRNYTNLEFNTIMDRSADYIIPSTFYDEKMQSNIKDGNILSLLKPRNKGVMVLEKIIEDIK